MDQLLTSLKPVLPGFRFHPTDEELFLYYLKRKCMGKSLSPRMMSEVDVYRFPPWDLPAKSWMKTRELSWYFFCPRSQKYARGSRINRTTEHGYWKSTGNDRTVVYNHRPVGKIKTLIFHLGKAPKGERTDWVMHEYRLEDKTLADKGVSQDLYVICKVYKKSGIGPKNGENYGAPFMEEEWETDDDEENDANEEKFIEAAAAQNGAVSDITNSAEPKHDDCAAAVFSPLREEKISQNDNGSTDLKLETASTDLADCDDFDKYLAFFSECEIEALLAETENTQTEEHKEDILAIDVTENTNIYDGLEDFSHWSPFDDEIGHIQLGDLFSI